MGASKNAVLVTEKIDELTSFTDLMYVFEHLLTKLNSLDIFLVSENKRSKIIIGTKRLVSYVARSHYYYLHYKDGHILELTSRMGRKTLKDLNEKEFICIRRGEYVNVSSVNVVTDNMVFLSDNSCHTMSKSGKERLEKRLKECYHGARNLTGDKDDDK